MRSTTRILLLMVVPSLGCKDTAAPPDGENVIGSEGGTISAAGGAVTLVVPPGALSAKTAITIEPATGLPAEGRLVTNSAYTFGPSGLTFAVPATLTIKYAAPVGPESGLKIHRLTGGAWTALEESAVQSSTRTVSAPLTRFSTYGVLGVEPASLDRIAFAGGRYDEEGAQWGLFTVLASGVGLRYLDVGYLRPSTPAWSPDRTRLAFVHHEEVKVQDDLFIVGDLFLVNVDGSGLTRLTNTARAWEIRPRWSPDGQRILFDRWCLPGATNCQEGIWVVNADGSGARRLIAVAGYDAMSNTLQRTFGADWSPDGSTVACILWAPGSSANTESLVIADAVSGAIVTAADLRGVSNTSGPRWSPDGTRILLFGLSGSAAWEEQGLHVINTDGTGLTRLIRAGDGLLASSGDWSPDGTRIVFDGTVTPSWSETVLYVMNADGTGIKRMNADVAQACCPSWR